MSSRGFQPAAAVRAEDLVREARHRLRTEAPFETSPREAAWLVGLALGWTEVEVLTRSRETVSPADAHRFRDLLTRRLTGEPFAYLKGEREFYGRSFRVDPRVLIPRPETEHLVEAVLAARAARTLPPAPRLLDIGTGSGCLAVTLDLEIPGARVTATDRSAGALAVARDNARRLGSAATFVHTDLACGLDLSRLDGIVANPPYLAPAEADDISIEVKGFEPREALFADREGFAILDRLLALHPRLRPGTWMALEIGASQYDAVRQTALNKGWITPRVLADLAGRSRVVLLAA